MNKQSGGVSIGTVIGLIYGITGGTGVYAFKGSVPTYANLPVGARVGDVYNVIAAYGSYPAGTNFAWDGTAWDALGGSLDLSNYLAKNNTIPFMPLGDYNPSTKKYVDDVVANRVKYMTGLEIYNGIAQQTLSLTNNVLCTENYNLNGFNYLVGHIYKVSLDTSVQPNQLITTDVSPCVYNFTNAQMISALSNGGALKNGDLVICQDTVEGSYTAGSIYYFNRVVVADVVQTSWTVLTQDVKIDNVSIDKNAEDELEAIALTDRINITTATEIRDAISINRSGTISLFKGRQELTMAEYEGLANIETDVDYNITDYPTEGLNNTQMDFALTCARLFPENTTIICNENGTYVAGRMYKIVMTGGVKSWEDITTDYIERIFE